MRKQNGSVPFDRNVQLTHVLRLQLGLELHGFDGDSGIASKRVHRNFDERRRGSLGSLSEPNANEELVLVSSSLVSS